jgi:putative spermidine/putrescine transport system substrate-binding protein
VLLRDHRMDRATFLRRAAASGFAVAIPGALAACGGGGGGGSTASGGGGGGEVVYSTWGGSWQDALDAAWAKPFTKESGTKVVFTGTPDYGKLQAMVQNKATTWDIAEVNSDFSVIGPSKGLLEPIDYNVVDKSVIPTQYQMEFLVPQLLWSRVITYRTDKFGGKKPKSWADVWNKRDFPGKRVFDATANGGAFETALMADGVPKDQIYPIDAERALRKLGELKGDILWFETGAQMTQWFSDGSGSIGLGWDGRINLLIDDKQPVAMDFNESIMEASMMVVPKGAPHKADAMKFLNFALSAPAQAAAAKAIYYGPVNAAAFDELPPEVAKRLSGNADQKGKELAFDAKFWGKNLDTLQQKLDAFRA